MGGPSTAEENTPNHESLWLLSAVTLESSLPLFLSFQQNAQREEPSEITEPTCLHCRNRETEAQSQKMH